MRTAREAAEINDVIARLLVGDSALEKKIGAMLKKVPGRPKLWSDVELMWLWLAVRVTMEREQCGEKAAVEAVAATTSYKGTTRSTLLRQYHRAKTSARVLKAGGVVDNLEV